MLHNIKSLCHIQMLYAAGLFTTTAQVTYGRAEEPWNLITRHIDLNDICAICLAQIGEERGYGAGLEIHIMQEHRPSLIRNGGRKDSKTFQ